MQKELDTIKINFGKYLLSLGISPKSHKNYRSDVTHFTNWLIAKVRSFGSYAENLTDAVPFISRDIVLEYKNEIVKDVISFKTANRRLSTLRHLSRFLTSTQVIDADFMSGIENITEFNDQEIKTNLLSHPAVFEFKSYLESEKISKNTIKNYLSDIKQFLVWLESKQSI
ncbi:MAG TPA: site-specific integrase [Patescibacteria group bacterium]|nr:site-specific integrase [Patescibacteria group bacterium]